MSEDIIGMLAGEKRPADTMTVVGDKADVSRTTSQKVKTLADLVRVCEIDTDEWVVVEWSCKASQQASIPRAIRRDGSHKWTRKSTDPVVTQMFHVSAKLRRKSTSELTLEALRAALVEDIRREVRAAKPAATSRVRPARSGWLFEFSPFDLHMGKYTWGEETVTNYDTGIAARLFDASLSFLLERAVKMADGKLEQVLCVFGNDVSHVDSKRGETTSGTRMDVDTRYIKVYRTICDVHVRAVRRLREVAPVKVVVVPGNHDELTSFHLGEILAARYSGEKHVSVDNGPRPRKYHEFGVNLFGFTHGHIEKVSELPLIMARENPDAWARCPSREWHIGHKHIAEKTTWRELRKKPTQTTEQDLYSDKGVRVRRLSSMSAHDFWHTEHGYMDRRACEGFVFHKEAGFTDQMSFNIDHFTGEPAVKQREGQ